MFIKKGLLRQVLGAAALLTMAGAANATLYITVDFDLTTALVDQTFSGSNFVTTGIYTDVASGSEINVTAFSGAPNNGFLIDTNLHALIYNGVDAEIRIYEDNYLLGSPTTLVSSSVTPTTVGSAVTTLVTSIDGQEILNEVLTGADVTKTILANLVQPTTIEHWLSIKNTSGSTSTTTFDTTTRVPEPSTIALLGLGLLGFAAVRRRQLNG